MTLAEQIAALRRTLNRTLTRRLARVTPRPFMQLCALRAIATQEAQTQGDLVERLLVDAPTVSRLVDRLETDGLLVRRAGRDRRTVQLAVTPAARPLIASVEAELAWLDEEIQRRLTPAGLETVRQLLGELQASLVEEQQEAARGRERRG